MSSYPCYLENAEQMLSEGMVRAAAQFLLAACLDTGFSTDAQELARFLRLKGQFTANPEMLRPILDRLKAATISGPTG